MRRQRRFFPQFYADLVQAGELSGAFAECIEQLSEDTIQTITAGRVVRDNLIYLGMVGSIQITLTIFLCIKILPIFKDILSDFGGKMIWPARMLMSLDLFFYGHGRGHSGFSWYGALFSEQASLPVALIAVVVVLVLTMAAIAVARRRRRRSYAACSISALFLWIPGLRRLVAKRNLAVIGLILEKLLRAGVPMDRALDSAGSAELNPAHARLVRRVRDRLLQGDGFGDAWKAESPARLVPPSFPALVALGERAGMLPEALGRLAELYQTDVNKWARICSDAVLPFGVLALGGFTFMVEISVYVSIMGISDTILGAL
jgi:type II secretory pathway component PulF